MRRRRCANVGPRGGHRRGLRVLGGACLVLAACGDAALTGTDPDPSGASDTTAATSADSLLTTHATLDAAAADASGATADANATDTTATDAPSDAGPTSDAGPACPVAPSNESTVAQTDRGLVRGQDLGDVLAFRGIPYAAPPVGPSRFRPPEAAACWDGIADATRTGAVCPQRDLAFSSAVVGDEDCLFLNLWTPGGVVAPGDATKAPRPVLVFIHGGGNVAGAGHTDPGAAFGALFGFDSSVVSWALGLDLYDGAALAARQDVVVVTFNYRLGALGFLTHPALRAESPHGAAGNLGLLDQLAALAWVQANIERFGGDPAHVMIFGQSAGAMDACALLASPLADGLFQAVGIESGPCMASTPEASDVLGDGVVREVGCAVSADVAACLRRTPARDFVLASPSLDALDLATNTLAGRAMFGPTIDGWVVPRAPLEALRDGLHQDVPLIVGSTEDELEVLLPPWSMPTCFQYEAQVDAWFGDRADDILDAYPCGFLDGRGTAVRLLTDMLFTCPARAAARAASAGQTAPVYRYVFAHTTSLSVFSVLGAFHGSELLYLFDKLTTGGLPLPAERTLSDSIGTYWRGLAAGVDLAAGTPAWPRYDLVRESTQLLDTPISTRDHVGGDLCDRWDAWMAPR